eukprot:Amastigsp_a341236_12.p6 type:complete len:122 gc:universal Amastigsp_a341236_12:67-432(+)
MRTTAWAAFRRLELLQHRLRALCGCGMLRLQTSTTTVTSMFSAAVRRTTFLPGIGTTERGRSLQRFPSVLSDACLCVTLMATVTMTSSRAHTRKTELFGTATPTAQVYSRPNLSSAPISLV